LAALRTDGLKLVSANGDLHLRSVHATDEPATVGTADIVIFAVRQPPSWLSLLLVKRQP
jgi:2-dehydropantoate 2-reductase